ncbi:MAG: WecB/TagA/CpsF family glycosyltransferase [Candidatus Eremiobacteraeota bacterium]|nr:WecB/TagA/CpsF family glycosyltransferase [Candidatus Eremiobacteraeota bacterium]
MALSPTRLDILGCPLDRVTMAQTLDTLRGYLKTDKFHLVVTIGSEMIVRAQTDHEFREAVRGAALVVPDSIGAVLAARYGGYPVRERVTGVELTQNMAQQMGPALRIFLLGGAPGVAETAAHRLLSMGPGVHIAGTHDGYFKDDAEIVAQVKASGANVLLVALGFPRQELWLSRHGAACGVQVGIGVGGTFDVLSGRVQRAPMVFQKLGMEWFYRLALQPSRWRRMLALPKFALRVLSGGKQAVKPMANS